MPTRDHLIQCRSDNYTTPYPLHLKYLYLIRWYQEVYRPSTQCTRIGVVSYEFASCLSPSSYINPPLSLSMLQRNCGLIDLCFDGWPFAVGDTCVIDSAQNICDFFWGGEKVDIFKGNVFR